MKLIAIFFLSIISMFFFGIGFMLLSVIISYEGYYGALIALGISIAALISVWSAILYMENDKLESKLDKLFKDNSPTTEE